MPYPLTVGGIDDPPWAETAELLYWRLKDIMHKPGAGDREVSTEMIRRLLEAVYDAGKVAQAMGLED